MRVVSLSSFGISLQRLGVSGENLSVIFENVQPHGVVTLLDWDPDMCRIVVRIKRQYAQIDVNTPAHTTSIRDVMECHTGNSIITKSLFLSHMRDLELSEEDAEAVFNALAPSSEIPLMPLNAVEWLDEWISEDLDIADANLCRPASLIRQKALHPCNLPQKTKLVTKDLKQLISSGDDLRNALKKKYGNAIRGWRCGFRVECPRIGRHIVMNACERLGLKVNGARMWAALTSGNNLSLAQFAPQEMSHVTRFLTLVDPINSFQKHFGTSTGKKEWNDMLGKRVGRALSNMIFGYFALESSSRYITSDDIRCLVRLCAESSQTRILTETTALSTLKSRRSLVDGQVRRGMLETKTGPQTLAEVVESINKRHGNVIRIIRKLFGNTSVDLTRHRFTTLLHEVNFVGSTKLFNQLNRCDRSGVVPLKAWAPQVAANLTRFQEEMITRYATAEECFAFFDKDGNGSLDRNEWHSVLMNFSDITPAMSDTLFNYISAETTRTISLPDIQWLYKAGLLRRSKEHLGLGAFLNVMSHNRTKAQGWREVDIAARGMCHWGDFVLACQLHDSMGKISNLPEAWLAIVKKVGRPFLTYADIDSPTAKAMLAFKDVMLQKYDSVKVAVESMFLPVQTCTSEDFAAALIHLGFYGDPTLLQSWVAERHDGEISLHPWSLCVLDTWEDFDPVAYKTRIRDPQALGMNTREAQCVRNIILEELNSV